MRTTNENLHDDGVEHEKFDHDAVAERRPEHDAEAARHGEAEYRLDDDALEPRIDPDSRKHLAEEVLEPPHAASRFDAGSGQGTVHGMPKGSKLQERPILDGSTQNYLTEASVPNPNRGERDPAQVTHQPALNTSSTNRWLKWSVVAAAVMVLVLLLLAQWSPVWCGIGIIVALTGVLAMLAVRLTRIRTALRLRIDAALMALIWLVPLAIFIGVIVSSSDEIWG